MQTPLKTMRQVKRHCVGHGLCNALVLVVFLTFGPLVGLSQSPVATTTPAALPPAAQEAVNKGVIAAKVPDYLLAIRYFEDARKIAPDAPIIYLNLGLAESKIPGRELRAIAWFGAYLAAYPTAPNASLVKEQITVLDIKNQSNVARLIKSVEAAAKLCCGTSDLKSVAVLWANSSDISSALRVTTEMGADTYAHFALQDIARIQVEAGDVTGALKNCDIANDTYWKSVCLTTIAETQIKAGDLAGAQKTLESSLTTAELIEGAGAKIARQIAIAETQIKAGDLSGAQTTVAFAQKTANLLMSPRDNHSLYELANAQAMTGDVAGAQKTVGLILDEYWKNNAQKAIAEAQASAAKNITLTPARPSTGTVPAVPPAIKTFDWIQKLDDKVPDYLKCPLNTGPFLDLEGYLKSASSRPLLHLNDQVNALPPDNPVRIFLAMRQTAEKLVDAQNVIHKMLKQQGSR